MEPQICERCYGPLNPADPMIRLGHIVAVRPDGEPVYQFAYLHAYEPNTADCIRAAV